MDPPGPWHAPLTEQVDGVLRAGSHPPANASFSPKSSSYSPFQRLLAWYRLGGGNCSPRQARILCPATRTPRTDLFRYTDNGRKVNTAGWVGTSLRDLLYVSWHDTPSKQPQQCDGDVGNLTPPRLAVWQRKRGRAPATLLRRPWRRCCTERGVIWAVEGQV
jgi:hypothetical protein